MNHISEKLKTIGFQEKKKIFLVGTKLLQDYKEKRASIRCRNSISLVSKLFLKLYQASLIGLNEFTLDWPNKSSSG
jgi:hypothetical protein